MDNPSLQEILAQVQAKNDEANSLMSELSAAKNELSAATEKVTQLEKRLVEFIGKPVVAQKQATEQPSLKEVVIKLLNDANENLTVKEIADIVLEQGYETNSKNFLAVVHQLLYANDDVFKRATRPKTRPARYTTR